MPSQPSGITTGRLHQVSGSRGPMQSPVRPHRQARRNPAMFAKNGPVGDLSGDLLSGNSCVVIKRSETNEAYPSSNRRAEQARSPSRAAQTPYRADSMGVPMYLSAMPR